jgi:hypothetical protein
MRHWHTVGLDIPRQVARLQSLTPLLQAMVILPYAKEEVQRTGESPEIAKARFTKFHVKIESGTQVASRGPTWRIATPLA